MSCEQNKLDSNITGLRFAEEECIKVLPTSPVWYPLEPNSYADFGGQIKTTPRNPINDSRQRKKGPTTDLDASGGFNTDWTQQNLQRLMQGFFFADLRLKADTEQNLVDSVNGNVPIIDIDGTTETYTLSNLKLITIDSVVAGGTGYTAGDVLTLVGGTFSAAATITVLTVLAGAVVTAEVTTEGRYSVAPSDPVGVTGGTGGDDATFNLTFDNVVTFRVGDLLLSAGEDDAQNNGLQRVTAVDVTGVEITVAEDLVTDASPNTDATLVQVGFQFAAGDLDVTTTGAFATYTTTTKDLTQFGLVPGEWIFVGGDTTATALDTAANNGFKRARSIAANALVVDKSEDAMVTEANAADTVRIFFGRCLKNESGSSIRRRTYQLERTLGAPDPDLPAEIQSEYLTGAMPNELTVNINTADKITADLTFIASDHETRSGSTGVKSGDRPDIVEADAFNTSSDFSRIKLAVVSDTDEAPNALFAFVTDLNLSINNNGTPDKAVSVLGAFDITAGTFEVGGKLTAYFADVAAVAAVRANSDVTLDFVIVRNNAGVAVDFPLIGLGDGRLKVEQDKPITLPLDTLAYDGAKVDADLDHTLLMCFFQYLPDLATPAA